MPPKKQQPAATTGRPYITDPYLKHLRTDTSKRRAKVRERTPLGTFNRIPDDFNRGKAITAELMSYIYPDIDAQKEPQLYGVYRHLLQMPADNGANAVQKAKNKAFNTYFPLYIHRLAQHLHDTHGSEFLPPDVIKKFFDDNEFDPTKYTVPYANMTKRDNAPLREQVRKTLSNIEKPGKSSQPPVLGKRPARTHLTVQLPAGKPGKRPAALPDVHNARPSGEPGTSKQHALLQPAPGSHAWYRLVAQQSDIQQKEAAAERASREAQKQELIKQAVIRQQQAQMERSSSPPKLPRRPAPAILPVPVPVVLNYGSNNRSPRVKSVFNNDTGLADWRNKALHMLENPKITHPVDAKFMETGFKASWAMFLKVYNLGKHGEMDYTLKQGVFPRGMVEHMYNTGTPLNKSGTTGTVKIGHMGPHMFVIKQFSGTNAKENHWREQDVHLNAYNLLRGAPVITIPWMTPTPFAVQTLAGSHARNSVTLFTALQKGMLSYTHKISLANQLCDFLVMIHTNGIIHNDLGGPNMMVTFDHRDPKLVVIDWGCGQIMQSRLQSRLTRKQLQDTRWPQPNGTDNPRCDFMWGLTWDNALRRKSSDRYNSLWDDVYTIRQAFNWDNVVTRYRQRMYYPIDASDFSTEV